MTLSADEFIRRFLLHVLPDGFQRIRYYGFLSNRHREEKLERCRQLLGPESADSTTPATEPPKDYRDRYEELTGVSLRLCPVCRRGQMIRVPLPSVDLHILNVRGHFMRPPGSQLHRSTHAPVRSEEKCLPDAPLTGRSRSFQFNAQRIRALWSCRHLCHHSSLHQAITLGRPFRRFNAHSAGAIEAV